MVWIILCLIGTGCGVNPFSILSTGQKLGTIFTYKLTCTCVFTCMLVVPSDYSRNFVSQLHVSWLFYRSLCFHFEKGSRLVIGWINLETTVSSLLIGQSCCNLFQFRLVLTHLPELQCSVSVLSFAVKDS